jgi:hypothetical protein
MASFLFLVNDDRKFVSARQYPNATRLPSKTECAPDKSKTRLLEIEAHLRRDLAVANAAAAEAAKATGEREALTKEWRRQVTNWHRQVYVVE